MVEEARSAASHPQDSANQQRLIQASREVSQALSKCVNCLPGQKDVDEAIANINKSAQVDLAHITSILSVHFLWNLIFKI